MDQRNTLLYPMMIVAAISVILFSVVGIATMTGTIPSAMSYRSSTPLETMRAPGAVASKAGARTAECQGCGVVASVQAVDVKGEGSGVGVVAGGVTGAILGNQVGKGNGRTVATVVGAAGGAYVGNEIEKETKKSTVYRVTVRMEDGSLRTVTQSAHPGFGVGEKVRLVDGQIMARS